MATEKKKQIGIYLDPATLRELDDAVINSGMSRSEWIEHIVAERLASIQRRKEFQRGDS